MVRISTFFSVSIDDLKHYAVIFVLKEGKIKLVTFRELKMILILSTMRLILTAMIAIQILTLNCQLLCQMAFCIYHALPIFLVGHVFVGRYSESPDRWLCEP